MSPEVARNIAIVVALALVVWLVPGGGEGAALVGQLLDAIFIVLLAFIGAFLYRRFRDDIFALGDHWRLALYAALGVAVVTLAGSRRLFESGAGTLVWFALLGACGYTLYLVWQRHRSYS